MENKWVYEEAAVAADTELELALEAPATPDGAEAEAGSERRTFEARPERPSAEDPLGLAVDVADGRMLHVCRVAAGGGTCIGRWNDSVPESHKIRVGDYITEVNGWSLAMVQPPTKPCDALRDQMRAGTEMVLKVARPVIWESTIQKSSEGLGFKLCHGENSIGLVIADVSSAAAARGPGLQVGDRVVGAGGTEGSPQAILRAINEAEGSVVLKLSRPAV